MPKFVDMTGQKFGRLTVVRLVSRDKWGKALWHCDCECGWHKLALVSDMRFGRVVSCGCVQKENAASLNYKHGHNSPSQGGKSPTYETWCAVMARCYNPAHHNYRNYGGRGIRVCDDWHTFTIFLADVGERPHGKTLDRIDVNRGYEPGNVRWATAKEQRANQRPVVRVKKERGNEGTVLRDTPDA